MSVSWKRYARFGLSIGIKFSLLKFLHPTSLFLSQTQQICGPFPTTLSIAFDVSIQRISLITFKRFGIFYDLHDFFSTMTKRAELCKITAPVSLSVSCLKFKYM